MLNSNARNAVKDILPVWLALALLTTAPYLIANYRAPARHVFTGVLTAYDDTFTYLAWMRQSANGHLLLCDLYTTEPHDCEFFFPIWIALGFASRLMGGSLAATFHAGRLFAALLLLITARSVARRVMKSRRRIRFALWLYALSGGLGWLVYALNNKGGLLNPGATSGAIDLNLPEAIAFRSVYAQVHFAVGAALLCGAINLLFIALAQQKRKYALMAGGLVSLLAVAHPYQIVVAAAVAACAVLLWPLLAASQETLLNRYAAALGAAAAFALASLPGAMYLIYLTRFNEALSAWVREVETLSPSPVEYILGFGIVGAFAIAGFRLMRNQNGRLLLIWAAAQAALLYAPTAFQRRFVEGLQLPLAVAASVAIFWLANRMKNYKTIFLMAVLVLASLTNAGFLIGQIAVSNGTAGASDPRRYAPGDLAAAFDWLSRNAEQDAAIMSSYMTGNIAPSMTGLRVFLGHYNLTLNSGEKSEQVAAFYSGRLASESARRLLTDSRVKYVIYGPFEREISASFIAPDWLSLVWSASDVQVYRVNE
jgi:hypothetical protein